MIPIHYDEPKRAHFVARQTEISERLTYPHGNKPSGTGSQQGLCSEPDLTVHHTERYSPDVLSSNVSLQIGACGE